MNSAENHISVSALAQHFEYETQVAALAQRYYEEEGCPEGRALDHWLRAEEEVRRRSRHADPSEGKSSGESVGAESQFEEAMRHGD